VLDDGEWQRALLPMMLDQGLVSPRSASITGMEYVIGGGTVPTA
jgi:hypothetical protein